MKYFVKDFREFKAEKTEVLPKCYPSNEKGITENL
jgi:hypothetical protein